METDVTTIGEKVAAGLLNNGSPLSKFGYVTGVNNTEVDLWAVGGSYAWLAANAQLEVVSSSADDASGGTGARTVRVYYLDNTFTAKTTDVTLNGTNVVATSVSDIYRVNAFFVITAGSGGKSAGNIDLRALADTPIYSRISTGSTRARNAMYTVPKSKTAFIQQITYSSGAAVSGHYTKFTMRATQNPNEFTASTIFYPYSEIGVQDQTFTITYQTPMKFIAGTDIKVSAISDNPSASAVCSCQYRGWTM